MSDVKKISVFPDGPYLMFLIIRGTKNTPDSPTPEEARKRFIERLNEIPDFTYEYKGKYLVGPAKNVNPLDRYVRSFEK